MPAALSVLIAATVMEGRWPLLGDVMTLSLEVLSSISTELSRGRVARCDSLPHSDPLLRLGALVAVSSELIDMATKVSSPQS